MTLYSHYIYSLLLYTINNKHLFNFNNEIYKYKTRALNNLYLPAVNLTKYNKGAFSHLPQTIKMLATDDRSFKSALRGFYITIPFIL
jgi:hypothetical protein